MNLVDTYKQLLENIQHALKKHGYSRKVGFFYKKYEDNWGIIGFQKSTSSSNEFGIKFTINLGVYSKAIAELLDPTRIKLRPTVWDLHWGQRIGLLFPEKNDKWWVIKEVYPEHTLESLDSALNNTLCNIDAIVEEETKKALEQHKQHLREKITEGQKLENSFIELKFGATKADINLDGSCLWVPASIQHDVDASHRRVVYGGVQILGIARHINPAYMKVLANQTRQAGQCIWQNKVWGDAARDYHVSLLKQQYPGSEVKPEFHMRTPRGARYLDAALVSGTELQKGYEVKTGNTDGSRVQQMKTAWMREQGHTVEVVRYPGCPVNLSNYTNCRVQ